MGRIDEDLIYIPEGERLPVLEFDKLDSFEDESEFMHYYEKYLGYFENDPLRLENERNNIEAWAIQHKRFNWEEFIERQFEGD